MSNPNNNPDLFVPRKRYHVVNPTNGTGSYAYYNGQNRIRFEIGSSGILSAPEVRLHATLNCWKDGATASTRPAQGDDINIDPITGVHSLINNLYLGSLRYSDKVSERIDNYPRLVASLHSAIGGSKNDFDCQVSHESFCSGGGSAVPSSIVNYTSENVASRPQNGGRNRRLQRKWIQQSMTFSVRLICGTLMSQEIDLDLLGGLYLELSLADDGNVFFGSAVDANTVYSISNPQLVAPIMDKDPSAPVPESINFLSFTSLYNVINSTNSSVVHRLNLRSVISLFQNYIPTSYINNVAQNSQSLYDPQIDQISYDKDGMKYPLIYTEEADNTSATSSQNKSLKPLIMRNYLNAFRNFSDLKHSLVTPYNLSPQQERAGRGVFGTGVAFDLISRAGIPCMNTNITTNIESELDDPANEGSQVKYSMFSYYLQRNSVDIQPGLGIQVVN